MNNRIVSFGIGCLRIFGSFIGIVSLIDEEERGNILTIVHPMCVWGKPFVAIDK